MTLLSTAFETSVSNGVTIQMIGQQNRELLDDQVTALAGAFAPLAGKLLDDQVTALAGAFAPLAGKLLDDLVATAGSTVDSSPLSHGDPWQSLGLTLVSLLAAVHALIPDRRLREAAARKLYLLICAALVYGLLRSAPNGLRQSLEFIGILQLVVWLAERDRRG